MGHTTVAFRAVFRNIGALHFRQCQLAVAGSIVIPAPLCDFEVVAIGVSGRHGALP